MKSVKLTRLVAALGCAAVLYSCQKDEKNTDPVTVTPDSVYVISNATYYSTDTVGTPAYKDTVYYTNNRISRISGDYTYDTLDYDFTYNTAGKISLMSAVGRHTAYDSYKQFYHFFYNSNNQIDSIALIDSSKWASSIFIKLTYDENKNLSGLTSTAQDSNSGEPFEWTSYVYYRNAANGLDSIAAAVYSSFGSYNFKFNTATADTSIQFSDAYTLVMAVRNSFIFMSSKSRPNLSFQQFLNPSDKLYHGGYYAGQPFSSVYTKNELGFLDFYSLKYTTTDGTASINGSIKFEYKKVPKQ